MDLEEQKHYSADDLDWESDLVTLMRNPKYPIQPLPNFVNEWWCRECEPNLDVSPALIRSQRLSYLLAESAREFWPPCSPHNDTVF